MHESHPARVGRCAIAPALLFLVAILFVGCGDDDETAGPDIVTESGLTCSVLEPGDGDLRPASGDLVTVHYTGMLADGTVFDSSRTKGRPFTFRLDKSPVIKGWHEGVAMMERGSRCEFTMPAAIAYGARGSAPRIPPNSELTFDIELLSVSPVPSFAALVPANTQTTPSGLQYEVLREGDGASPGATDPVTVFYSGWLENGTPFDSAYERGLAATFPLDRVIPGWTEGLQLMREGAIYRFRIPSELAYGERGKPPKIPEAEPLNFVVELLSVGD